MVCSREEEEEGDVAGSGNGSSRVTSFEEDRKMKAEERSRTKRNKGSVRDDMGAIVGVCIMYEYAMLSDQVDRTDRDVRAAFPLSTAHVAVPIRVVGDVMN